MLLKPSRLALIAALAATPVTVAAQTTETPKPQVEAEVTTQAEAEVKVPAEGDAAATAQTEATTETETADTATETETQTDMAAEGTTTDGTVTTQTDTETAVDTESGATATATAEATTEAPAKPVQGQIVMQTENSILANELIGRTVYSPTDESIGDVNDIIVSLDGKVEGVVIGVGGFLGMGEKDVAIEMQQLEFRALETGAIRLTLNATEADLEAAEAFVSSRAQREEADRQAAMEQVKQNTTAPTN